MKDTQTTILGRRILSFMGYYLLILAANSLPIEAGYQLEALAWRPATKLALLIAVFILSLSLVIFLAKQYQQNQPETPSQAGFGWQDFLVIVVLLILMNLVTYGLKLANYRLFDLGATANSDQLTATKAQGRGWVDLAYYYTTLIIAPLGEEIVHRGLWTQDLFQGKSHWLVAVLGAAIFALAHRRHNFIDFFIFFFSGLFYFLAYYRRMKISDAVLLHLANNFLAEFGEELANLLNFLL